MHELQFSRPCHSRRPFPSQAIPRKTCGGQSCAGKGFTPRTSVFAFQYHSTYTPYSFASEYYYCNTRRTRGRSLGTFRQSNAVSDIWDHCTQKYFHIFLRASSFKSSLIMTPEKKNVVMTNIKYVHLWRYADSSWFIHLAILTCQLRVSRTTFRRTACAVLCYFILTFLFPFLHKTNVLLHVTMVTVRLLYQSIKRVSKRDIPPFAAASQKLRFHDRQITEVFGEPVSFCDTCSSIYVFTFFPHLHMLSVAHTM